MVRFHRRLALPSPLRILIVTACLVLAAILAAYGRGGNIHGYLHPITEGENVQLMNRGGDANWPHVDLPTGTVLIHIKGQATASGAQSDWKTVAVLQVDPSGEMVRPGFMNGDNIQALRTAERMPNGRFGMRIGPGDVNFFALPAAADQPLPSVKLIALTREDDPKYASLPLY